ncbi:unnamed protein product [Closterium sp. Yama58-4]|nr:unnamed protein product [Closterium sp. Yama58-4]
MYDTSAVPIFTGQNYSAWKFKFQVLMMERGLWGLFDGTEKKPDDESDIAAWKKKDQKAFATLISRIGINLVSSVRTCIKLEASAHEAWKRPETMHENKTLHGKILARNAFYTVKLRAGESMHEYATRVEELGETFMDLGGTVTEENWILTLLCGLPEAWSTVITTLDSARDEEGNAHTASGEADDSKESLVLVAGNGNEIPSDAWFLDTGATQHMTHSASLLNNIGAPGDVTSIVFGNNESLPVVGVGSTRLIVDSGPVDVMNVLHVPGVKVNLLSVPQLAKKGVIATIDGAKMNLFWKGKQFAQGVLNGDIYQLKTYPRAASSNMASSIVAQGSKATLKAWHNRLAHANYDSVKELAKKGLAKGVDVIAGDDEKGVCAACVEGKMTHKFPSKEKPTQQVTFILPAREEVEESEVPTQVEKEAENGGGENNEESVDDVVEVSPTEAATTSTPSSLPLALTRGRREVRPPPKYKDYATVAVGETDKEGAAFCFATKGDDEQAEPLMEPPPKDQSRAYYEHVGLHT